MLRQAAALCTRNADRARNLFVLDSEIDTLTTCWLRGAAVDHLQQPSMEVLVPGGVQMILFPLMTPWMWVEILAASLSASPPRRSRNAGSRAVGADNDPGLFPLLQPSGSLLEPQERLAFRREAALRPRAGPELCESEFPRKFVPA